MSEEHPTAEPLILKQPTLPKGGEPKLLGKYFSTQDGFNDYLSAINEPKYLFWSKAMHREPPKGFDAREAWLTARTLRKFAATKSPVNAVDGEAFTWQRLAAHDEIMHRVDQQTSGKFLITTTSVDDRQKWLSRGILEEAIASSQLEGASTTRKYAKKMIAENKKPRNVSEQMIFNNYRTMAAIDDEYKNQLLSLNLLKEMHSQLTMDTLDEPTDVGNLRVSGDTVHVLYNNKIVHTAPPREFVEEQLEQLITFANDDKTFMHPIIKASMLHFWIGYLHPFADGNGRLARSIFYWYLLKNDYWGMAYIPISMVIKRAQKQYTIAYVHSEQDNHDLTYFIDYSLRRIDLALKEFNRYVDNLHQENHLIDLKLRGTVTLNDRQKQLVYFLVSEPTNSVSELSHRTMTGIARGTARADLTGLYTNDLVQRSKEGKQVKYYASEKLFELIGSPAKPLKMKKKPAKTRGSRKKQASLFEQ